MYGLYRPRTPADIRTAVDEFYDLSADAGGKQSQVMYECLSLLCGGAGPQGCGGGIVGGGRFADNDAFVERLSFRLEQDRAQQKRVRTWYYNSERKKRNPKRNLPALETRLRGVLTVFPHNGVYFEFDRAEKHLLVV